LPPGLVRELVDTLYADVRIGVFSFVVNTFAGSALVPRLVRVAVLRSAGIRVGRAQIRSDVTFTTSNVEIGSQAYVNRGCFFDSQGGITIGARVHLGYGVICCTSTHEPGDASCRAGTGQVQPVNIKDGCWIGTRAVILPGVTVGEGCVVASGAIVIRDCAPHGLYGGVPAHRLRDLPS
jgi:maltose O-acetyltransferase